MSTLNREELNELLQQKTPDEIADQEKDRLDDAGKAFLEQRRAHPEIEDFLRDSGRYTREQLDNPPEFTLPQDFDWEPKPSRLYRFFFGGVKVPGFVMAAVLLAGFLVFQFQETIVIDKGAISFERIKDEPGAEPLDKQLFEALKQRGIYFFNKGEETGEVRYYKEAYNDLTQAFMMDNTDDAIRQYLIRAHNIINEDYEVEE
ncbi:MAG: hypothetical protein QNK37_11735 [Acidobacteriota bacterium]|nr:hypothetical protein [Acidobacteriota bacterium]